MCFIKRILDREGTPGRRNSVRGQRHGSRQMESMFQKQRCGWYPGSVRAVAWARSRGDYGCIIHLLMHSSPPC